jgi:lipid-A-disaccharide synthase-like uncharacterized protein
VSAPGPMWLAIGLVGQVLFSMRFLVQWISSERSGQSVLPVSFWHLSIAGSLTLLAYAVHRGDLVFTIGQSAGVLIYARNLQLMRTARRTLDRAP